MMYYSRSFINSVFILPCLVALTFALSSCKPKDNDISSSKWLQKVNIYMGGELGDSVTYWENGKPISLNKKGLFANAVIISQGDTYLAGSLAMENNLTDHINTRAIYSKNGTVSFLTDGQNTAIATGISISGADVYVVGYEYNGDIATGSGHDRKSIAKYWKNGIPVTLTDGSTDARATAIAVKGADVYVAGYEKNEISVARCWKNGKPVAMKIDSNISIAQIIQRRIPFLLTEPMFIWPVPNADLLPIGKTGYRCYWFLSKIPINQVWM